ncbi:major capsid protein [Streptomyces caniscabiei]|uniref:Major capsid protein n=1 Tax=Streptomyces caniscabiei TaxID=2746961 RepID=A0ABU4MRP8_9ACTN|nr:major capsid protein [Streptomyces caniscabiei]MBE4788403.1 major capsid protein [Streptomyces caniscabiei]MDX2954614.1 major capsid protein [Streptomyces caniscabiei]MDX2986585.1 major capsid protein [Streptomyces caniscabiei]MDX3039464.1 major capsid protein [Streptomyces caniscabiei]
MADELFSAPSDLTLASDPELTELETRAVAEFERVSAIDGVDPDTLAYAMRLTDDLDRIRAELRVREVRAQANADLQRTRVGEQLAALKERVHGEPAGDAHTPAAGTVDAESIAQATAQGVTAALSAFMMDRRGGNVRPEEIARRATASLAETARHAPAPKVPEQRLAITASVDIPGVAHGGQLASFEALTDVVQRKAKSMPVTRGNPNNQLVASVRNEFEHTLDERSSPAQVKELFDYLTSPEKQQALVAGGGWCAPSEIRYDFFNIACSSGLIDLPTVGVTRGGIQFPVSPSLADTSISGAFGGFAVTFDGDSNPWLWTEDDDIAAATGSPTKPCIRVPCPTFDEERLELYGVCLTAGNLADSAYPEATQHMIRLLMAAHDHAMNARLIALMVAASSTVTSITGGASTDAAAPRIYNAVGLAAADYRERFGMCLDDVLEVVLPAWVREVIRGDLAWKAGVELQAVPNSEIDSYFTARNVRVQWVDDWQVRGSSQFGHSTAMTAWPTTVDFLIYAAGTFIHGNGMSLDLGVVRDSVLNETNDHTALWSEEAHLIARVGHESRQYRVGFNVNGSTSALHSGTVRV